MNRRLLLTAAVLCPLAGCEWMKNHGISKPDNYPGKHGSNELRKVEPQELVNYLNERADRLQSITQADVVVTARDRSMVVPVPVTLRGTLAASQPRNFRMSGGAMVDGKVDLGSNDEQFWVYAKVPSNDAMFMYASHDDFQTGKAKIPGGIPFEPEWVMQAFGMAHFPPTPATGEYRVKPDEKNRTYTLSWPAVTPNRVAVVKEVVFDSDTATGTKPQVKKHTVRDAKSNKPICYAEVKEARTVQTTAAAGGQPVAVQYPTRIFLRWEEQKFEMELELRTATINQPPTPEEQKRYFIRPNVPGANAIDLATWSAPARP